MNQNGALIMHIVCLDLEGVLTPEIWIAFAEETGIEELRLTTRDIPDYSELMNKRIEILARNNLTLKNIRQTIAKINPLDGAEDFLNRLREITQVIILSDTFTQFAAPLMQKLGRPTIFCNSLKTDAGGKIIDFELRQANGKFHAVRALQSIGFKVAAAGDSYNDLTMLKTADAGFLFRAPERIKAENPQIEAFNAYDQLLNAFKDFCAENS